MTSAQVVETSVKVTPNSPSQDYSHPDDHNLHTYDMTPGFKPFTTLGFDRPSLYRLIYEARREQVVGDNGGRCGDVNVKAQVNFMRLALRTQMVDAKNISEQFDVVLNCTK